MNDGARQGDPLLQSFRQPRSAILAPVGDLKQRERLVDGLLRIGKPIEARVDGQVLANSEVVPQAWRFSEKSDACAQCGRGARVIASASICTEPDVGAMSPASIRSVVVLPAPLGPSKAKISPALIRTTHRRPPADCRTAASGAVRSARACPWRSR